MFWCSAAFSLSSRAACRSSPSSSNTLPVTLYSFSSERLFGIPFLLAFGFQHTLEACPGGLNIFLLNGVRSLLETVENLDYVSPPHVEYSIPCSRILLAQFVNTGA